MSQYALSVALATFPRVPEREIYVTRSIKTFARPRARAQSSPSSIPNTRRREKNIRVRWNNEIRETSG